MQKKILIVDDDHGILLVLSELMKSPHLVVVQCDTAAKAKKALSESAFDLVITDVRLTGKNCLAGLDLLDHVRLESPLTEVIIMTGDGTDEIKERVQRQKAYFFEKSSELSHLLCIVQILGIMDPGPCCEDA
ncbi:MAG: response regulator [Nitrospirota bacterium]|nr:response regulator [Nitrospirota bacterium]